MQRKIVLLFLLAGCSLAILCVSAQAQLAMLYGKESSFFINGGLTASPHLNTLGGEVGYIGSGIFSLSLCVERLTFENPGLQGVGFLPKLALKPIGLSIGSPIEFTVLAGYAANRYLPDQLQTWGIKSLRENTYNLGAIASSQLKLGRSLHLVPSLGVQYFFNSQRSEFTLGNPVQTNYHAAGFDAQAGLRWNILPTAFLVAASRVILFEDETAISANFILGFHRALPHQTYSSEPAMLKFEQRRTRLANFRARFPKYKKKSDQQILAMCREYYFRLLQKTDDPSLSRKYQNMLDKSDAELIRFLETKHAAPQTQE